MQDALHELATPMPVAITLGGRALQLSKLRAADVAELQRRYIDSQPNPLAAVVPFLKDVSEEQAKHLLDLAYRDTLNLKNVDLAAVVKYQDTSEGLAVTLWLQLRRLQPDVTESQVATWIGELGAEELNDLATSLLRSAGTLKN